MLLVYSPFRSSFRRLTRATYELRKPGTRRGIGRGTAEDCEANDAVTDFSVGSVVNPPGDYEHALPLV